MKSIKMVVFYGILLAACASPPSVDGLGTSASALASPSESAAASTDTTAEAERKREHDDWKKQPVVCDRASGKSTDIKWPVGTPAKSDERVPSKNKKDRPKVELTHVSPAPVSAARLALHEKLRGELAGLEKSLSGKELAEAKRDLKERTLASR